MHDGTPQTAADCLVARMMIGEVIGALDDLAAVGITGSNLQILRASAATVTARLDGQIAAAWAAPVRAQRGLTANSRPRDERATYEQQMLRG